MVRNEKCRGKITAEFIVKSAFCLQMHKAHKSPRKTKSVESKYDNNDFVCGGHYSRRLFSCGSSCRPTELKQKLWHGSCGYSVLYLLCVVLAVGVVSSLPSHLLAVLLLLLLILLFQHLLLLLKGQARPLYAPQSHRWRGNRSSPSSPTRCCRAVAAYLLHCHTGMDA